ncbi:sensor histidine kinase [Rhodococcus sp. 06-156-3C]|nr:sensor histidine kinase [Rhodococcus sp. 06-156-4C]OZD21965.1 sensor histidine kinase [Rhodococcus sp. 06-156-3C]OZD24221.1 sensor histidine kinase [Rhodococcus sp. 06-156-4a]OZD29306.1 sensor histidine kinase [Rhodococcus sp. 06-156-3b]OZD29728.1 sensor histidine kinase [Rhodococcus sp. 06-156-3]OZF59984.1 sensor histidine kinase [Rhodococcus sp. 06-156-4]
MVARTLDSSALTGKAECMTTLVEIEAVDTESAGTGERARSMTSLILRAPIDGRTWREGGYLLVSSMLGALGAAYLFVGFMFGTVLVVLLVGIPILAAVIVGARAWGVAFRLLSDRLLGTHVPAPQPFRWQGVVGSLAAALTDRAGWRAILFMVIQSVVALASVFGAFLFLVIALAMALSPVVGVVFDPTQLDSDGNVRHSFVSFGSVYFDTWPQMIVLVLLGIVCLFVAPWPIRLLAGVERFLIEALLGESEYDVRVAQLETTRAVAVDDSAATLRRVERDLHDGTQARLVTMAMALGRAEDKLARGEDATELITAAHGTAKDALRELREVVRGIHPPALDLGLEAALKTLAARSAVPTVLSVHLGSRPSRSVETIAYFSVAELLTNIVKHAHASTAWISVREEQNRVVVAVRDNGIGGAVPGAGTGITGLESRASTVDGTMTVASPAGGPTVVTLVLPMTEKG